MLTVSRTPVAETWLSSLPFTPKDHQPLGAQAVIKIKQDRYSVSSINTDLFPELLSWSAMMSNNQPISPSQSLPSDVSRPGDSDTDMEASLSLTAIFDPTTLNFGFDPSCFDGLDDTLVYSPLSAFADTCWSELHSHTDRATTSAPVASRRMSRRRRTRSPLVASTSSDDSDTESDDCKTVIEDDLEPILGNGLSSGIRTVGDFTSYDTTPQSLYFSDHYRTSFMLFESRFPAPDPKESVGAFPIHVPQHRKNMSSRFAAFRAHLPSSLTFVRPLAH